MGVTPSFENNSLVVVANKEIFRKFSVRAISDIFRSCYVGFTGALKFGFRTIFLAIGAIDEQHDFDP